MDDVVQEDALPLADLAPAGLQRVLEVWRDGAAGRAFCPREDFRPERLGAEMYRVMLVEETPAASGHEFRLRLAGAGTEYPECGLRTGGYVDQVRPAVYRDLLLHHYRDAIHAAAPQFHRVHGEIAGKHVEYWRLTLPMSLSGRSCDMLLVAVHKAAELLDQHEQTGLVALSL